MIAVDPNRRFTQEIRGSVLRAEGAPRGRSAALSLPSSKRMPRTILTLAIALVWTQLSIAGADAGQSRGGGAKPPASTPPSIAAGGKLFRTHCRMCHGNDAKGDGPEAPRGSHPPNLTDETWIHGSTDAEIFEVIRNGVGPKFDMKGFRSRLTTEEMWSLVHYLRSLPASSTR